MALKTLLLIGFSIAVWNQAFASPKLLQIVRFTLSARGIPKMDFWTKSDPLVEVYKSDKTSHGFAKIGSTELLRDTNNPVWQTLFTVEYNPDTNQRIRFVIKDIDVNRDDTIGTVEVTLSAIVKGGNVIEREIPRGCKRNTHCGYLRIFPTVSS